MRLIRFILVFILITGIVGIEEAETEEVEEVELGKIIVTSRRTQVGLTEVTENVTVISEEEIKQLPARDLGEALKYITGIDIDPRQGFGRATSISIQGCDSRHVRVMIDGIPLNSQALEEVDPSGFPIEIIERIEVIKGAGSSMWGSSLGGVINIITKDTGTTLIPKGSITTSFAEFRTRKESLDLSGKVGDLGYYLFSSYMESGGEGPKDDVLEKKAFGKLSYDLKDMGKITSSFGYSGADVNNGVLPGGSWDAQPYRIRYGKVGWELNSGDMDIKVDLKHSRQDVITRFYFSLDDEEPYSTTKFKDVLYQLSLNSTMRPRGIDLFVIGADFDWDTIRSNIYLSKAKNVKLQAPYANYTLKLEPWDLNFGLRYDHNSEFGEEFSPSFGVVYHMGGIPDTLIRAGVSRAFNAPLLLWIYNENPAWSVIPNPNLGPERAWVYESGIESQPIPELWIKFSVYRADVYDAIDWAQNAFGEQYMKNFEKFRRQGVEAQIKLNIFEGLDFFGGGAFNDIEDRATKKTVKGGGKPRQSFDLGLEYKNKNGFNLSLRGYYDYWNEPASSQANDRKMLFDLKILQEFKNFSFFLNIYNLADSPYWRDYYYPVPERYFEGGISLLW